MSYSSVLYMRCTLCSSCSYTNTVLWRKHGCLDSKDLGQEMVALVPLGRGVSFFFFEPQLPHL